MLLSSPIAVVHSSQPVFVFDSRPKATSGQDEAATQVTKPPVTGVSVDSVETLVIVRTHSPNAALLERMRLLAQDVSTQLPSALFILSVDDTGISAPERLLAPFLRPEQIFRYDEDLIRARFPLTPVEWHGRSNQAEPTVLAVEHARPQLRKDAFVWVLEEDVLVCGSFARIAEKYTGDRSDFIASSEAVRVLHWAHKGKATAAFKDRYPLEKRSMTWEFMQRYSMRILEKMRAFIAQGITARSEMLAPTVCANEGFTLRTFESAHLGVWGWARRVMPEDEERICRFGVSMSHAAKGVREFNRRHLHREQRAVATKDTLVIVRTRGAVDHVRQLAWSIVTQLPSALLQLSVGSDGFAASWLSPSQVHVQSKLQVDRSSLQRANATGSLRSDAFIWVVHEEFLPCGVFRILRSYKEHSSDLITSPLRTAAGPTAKATKEFKRRFPPQKRVRDVRGVRRFSMRLLQRLWGLSEENVKAGSEMFAATVCKEEGFGLESYSEKELRQLGVGSSHGCNTT